MQRASRCPCKMPLEPRPPAEAPLGLEISLYVFSDARQHGDAYHGLLNDNYIIIFSSNRDIGQDIDLLPVHDDGKGRSSTRATTVSKGFVKSQNVAQEVMGEVINK